MEIIKKQILQLKNSMNEMKNVWESIEHRADNMGEN